MCYIPGIKIVLFTLRILKLYIKNIVNKYGCMVILVF